VSIQMTPTRWQPQQVSLLPAQTGEEADSN
jgi:hypothetical protein